LAPGNYRLVQFLVLNNINTVIYAAPLEGSILAYLINDPLPLNFAVAKNESTQVAPQVLAVRNDDTPENFGYVSFGFKVVNTDSVVLIRANVKMEVGGLLYENVDALINIKGYDSTNKIQWTRKYNFIGPSDMVLEVRNGFHHYRIELEEKWGVRDVKNEIAGKDLWKGRADGPVPVTYTLLGSRKAKKILKSITSSEVNIAGGGTVYQPEYGVAYMYKANGHIESIHHEIYNAELSQFEESHIETFIYQDNAVSKIIATRKGKPFSELNYTYGIQNRIVEKNSNSGITTTQLFAMDSLNKNAVVRYESSNGQSFLYNFDFNYNNIIKDKTTKAGQRCSDGVYAYDKNINPFRQLGYIDFNLQNWSVNNKLTEHVHFVACSFPTLIPVSHEYIYDNEGYPLRKITTYKTGYGENAPNSPYHRKVDFYYE
jgi:hypothetical protein